MSRRPRQATSLTPADVRYSARLAWGTLAVFAAMFACTVVASEVLDRRVDPPVPDLLESLRNPESDVRLRAVASLGRKRSLPPDACMAVARALDAYDLRAEATVSLVRAARRGHCLPEVAFMAAHARHGVARAAAAHVLDVVHARDAPAP